MLPKTSQAGPAFDGIALRQMKAKKNGSKEPSFKE